MTPQDTFKQMQSYLTDDDDQENLRLWVRIQSFYHNELVRLHSIDHTQACVLCRESMSALGHRVLVSDQITSEDKIEALKDWYIHTTTAIPYVVLESNQSLMLTLAYVGTIIEIHEHTVQPKSDDYIALCKHLVQSVGHLIQYNKTNTTSHKNRFGLALTKIKCFDPSDIDTLMLMVNYLIDCTFYSGPIKHLRL